MPLSRSFKSLQIRYVITATLLIGIGTYIMQAPPKSPYAFNQKHTLSGHITSLKESQSHYRNRTHYSLTFKTAKSSLLAYLSCKNCQLKLGDHITLSGLLVALPQKRNPGQFDWSSFYAKKGITGKLIKPKLIDHKPIKYNFKHRLETCLLYTSDAADE